MVKKLLWVVAILVVLFGVIQLIPINRQNPVATREVKWDSTQTRDLAKRACFDCHSDETTWPWYSKIAPVSLLVADHVDEGRRRLNFSEWDKPNSDFKEVNRTVETGRMPLKDYLWMHPDALLSDQEKTQMLDGLQKTFQGDPPVERRGFGED